MLNPNKCLEKMITKFTYKKKKIMKIPPLDFFHFFIFFFLNLKLRVNLKFYKCSRGIKVILPILPYDLTPNPNGRGGHCIKLEVR